jgi:hypothetical protein
MQVPAPGETRPRIVRLNHVWLEEPPGGERSWLAHVTRFCWPEVCVREPGGGMQGW